MTRSTASESFTDPTAESTKAVGRRGSRMAKASTQLGVRKGKVSGRAARKLNKFPRKKDYCAKSHNKETISFKLS